MKGFRYLRRGFLHRADFLHEVTWEERYPICLVNFAPSLCRGKIKALKRTHTWKITLIMCLFSFCCQLRAILKLILILSSLLLSTNFVNVFPYRGQILDGFNFANAGFKNIYVGWYLLIFSFITSKQHKPEAYLEPSRTSTMELFCENT